MMKKGRDYWPLLVWPLVAWAVLAVAGYKPTLWAVGDVGPAAMAAGQAVVVGAAILTLLLVLRRIKREPPGRHLQLVMKAGVIRFLLTLAAAGGILWRSDLHQGAFLVWLAITYVVVVNLETVALVRWMKRIERQA